MDTAIIKISNPDAISMAKSLLLNGGVIAVPTDTVYGIACSVRQKESILRMYEIKKRNKLKAIPVLIANLDQVDLITGYFPPSAKTLAETFWPGALTIVVEKNPKLPAEMSTYNSVGIRMPDHDWLRSLINICGPLAVTSANISGQSNSASAVEVLQSLGGMIDALVDGGTCPGGIPSTVVDCTSMEMKILRGGTISDIDIQKALQKE